jgi:hypothetical protein
MDPTYSDRQAMADRDKEKLDRQVGRLEKKLPDALSRIIRRLREPSARWVRIPLAIVFICGGLFGFLPVLGLWMLPLGVLLLAQDLTFLRKPTRRALVWLERRWVRGRGFHGVRRDGFR